MITLEQWKNLKVGQALKDAYGRLWKVTRNDEMPHRMGMICVEVSYDGRRPEVLAMGDIFNRGKDEILELDGGEGPCIIMELNHPKAEVVDI